MPKVFIEVGHGGKDPGASANQLIEKALNLDVAIKLKSELERHGVDCMLSRTSDTNTDLMASVAKCNIYKPDIALGVHFNAGGGDGFEAFVSMFQTQTKGVDMTVAKLIEIEVKAIGQNSRGVKTKKNDVTGRDYFAWNREVAAPSIILEGAFLDSKDYTIADTKVEQEAIAVAYAKGVLKYFKIAYKEDKPIVVESKPVATAPVAVKKVNLPGVIIANNATDHAYATILRDHLKINKKKLYPIVTQEEYTSMSAAVEYFGVGAGPFSDRTDAVIISGNTRFDTVLKVLKYCGIV